MTRYLLTGAAGYLGQKLLNVLMQQPDSEVYGLVRQLKTPPHGWVAIEGDVLTLDWKALLLQVQPDVILHLAYASRHAELQTQLETTVSGTCRLLDGVLAAQIKPLVIIPGSAAEYGPHPTPIAESAVCQPVLPYGIAKLAQTQAALQYWQNYQIPVVIGRIFNLYGQTSSDFAIAKLASQIAELEQMPKKPAVIKTHNLVSSRDFIHIDDVVEALLGLVEAGKPGEIYNIASGQATLMQAVLDQLLSSSLLQEVEVQASSDQFSDISCANIEKIQQQTPWRPSVSLEAGLAQELKYWRTQVQVY